MGVVPEPIFGPGWPAMIHQTPWPRPGRTESRMKWASQMVANNEDVADFSNFKSTAFIPKNPANQKQGENL